MVAHASGLRSSDELSACRCTGIPQACGDAGKPEAALRLGQLKTGRTDAPKPKSEKWSRLQQFIKRTFRLGALQDGAKFRWWVMGIITNNARAWRRRFLKNNCTIGLPDDTYLLETMSVEVEAGAERDVKNLLEVLYQKACAMPGRRKAVALAMLDYCEDHCELPSLRVLERLTGAKHATVQLTVGAVLRSWQRQASALGLHP